MLISLETNPFLGKSLGNKAGIDLAGYHKLYIFKKKTRIIYGLIDNELIVNIISTGKRKDFIAYLQAYLRIK